MDYQLAQLNIAQMRYTCESAEMAYFVQQLDTVNALADRSPGFIWRLQSDEGNATEYHIWGDPGYLQLEHGTYIGLSAQMHVMFPGLNGSIASNPA